MTMFVTDADGMSTEGAKWNKIAISGEWKGHRSGEFRMSQGTFEEIVQNWKNDGAKPIPIDFEHASEADGSEGSIPREGAPAQGWVLGLDARGGELWALTKWLPLASEYIKSGQYKYCSPAIRFNARDRVTGKAIGARLTSLAITNAPFLAQLPSLAAKDKSMAETTETIAALGGSQLYAYSSHEYMPKLRTALRLTDMATARECSEAMDRLSEHYAVGGGKPVHGVPVHEYVDALRDALNVPMTSTVEDIFEAVNEMIAAAIAEHEEEYHEGEPAMTDDEETETMSDKETTKLRDENADLSKQLKAANDKIEAHGALLTSKDEQIAKLTSTLAERDARDDEARVQKAMADYKDKKPMAEASMRALLKADRPQFEKEFPPLRPGQEHMLLDLTGRRTDAGDTAAPDLSAMPTTELTKHIMATDKVDYVTAMNRAASIKRHAMRAH